MLVNKNLKEPLCIGLAMVVASTCGWPAAFSAEQSQGWETGASTASPDAAKTDNAKSQPAKSIDDSQSAAETGKSAPGWNEPESQSRKPVAGSTPQASNITKTKSTSAPDSDVVTAGDTALAAGNFAQALKDLDEAWRVIPATPRDSLTTAKFLERKAIAFRGLQQLTEAERMFKQALGHATASSIKDPELHGRILYEVSDILSQEGLPIDGAATAAQAVKVLGNTASTQGTTLEVEALNTEARLFTDTGDPKSADEELQKALKAASSLPQTTTIGFPPQSAVSRYSEFLKGKINNNISYLLVTQGKEDTRQQLDAYDSAASVLERFSPISMPDTRFSIASSIADGALLPSKKATAQGDVTAALNEAGKTPGPQNLTRAYVLYVQSQLQMRKNDNAGALESLKSCYAIQTKVLPANSTHIAATLIQLGKVCHRLGRALDAASYSQRAHGLLERSAGKDSLIYADACLGLATIYMSANKYAQLEPLLSNAARIYAKIQSDNHPNTLHALDMLSSTYIRNRKYTQAATVAARALAEGEKRFGPSSPSIVLSLTNLGVASAQLKKVQESNAALQRAQAILTRSGKSNTSEYADLLAAIGVANGLQQKWDSARTNIKQAQSIYSRLFGKNSAHVVQMSDLLATLAEMKEPHQRSHNLLFNRFTPSSPEYR